jgi:hypothetical protein
MTDAGGLYKPEPHESKEAFKRRMKAALGIRSTTMTHEWGGMNSSADYIAPNTI